jgi:membrane protease YdiL (CAAX protease family)
MSVSRPRSRTARRPPPSRAIDALGYDYVQRTRELPVNLLFLMPWLLVYELSLIGTGSAVENAAAAWIRAAVRTLGRDGLVAVTLLVSLLLCVVVLMRLREATRDRGVYGGMLLEGVVYGALLGTVAQTLASGLPMERLVSIPSPPAIVGPMFATMQAGLRDLGLAVGAGIFEEFVFRGLLLSGIYSLMRHGLGTDRISAGVLGVLISSYLFSDYHHWGATGEPYDASIFAFRFYAGAALGVVFLSRGLGIAAFAHGFYDVMVMSS